MSTASEHYQQIDASTARKKLEASTRLHWFHWAIVLLSLLLTFIAWSYSKNEHDTRVALQFDREADRMIELVQERMRKYEDALRSGVAMHIASRTVDFDTWQTYATSLHLEEKYPGINGIGVISAVAEAELEEYLSEQRKRRPDFKIHPQHQEQEYYPITYIIPVKGNEQAVGLDIAHEENRYTAARKARDSGSSQITGPITLVQDSGQTPGFLFYSPFYSEQELETLEARRQHFEGLIYAPFVMKKLMQGTLAQEKRQVGIRINDGKDILFDEHHETESDFDPNPIHQRTVDVPMYGRTWVFDIRSAKSFRAASQDHQPLTILLSGIFIDCLLFFLFIFITRSSQKTLSYADSMTNQLEEKNNELQKVNEDLNEFAYIASHDLRSPLNSIQNLVTWIKEDNEDILPEDSRKHLEQVRQRTTRLMQLLDDLLIYARASRKNEVIEETNVKQLITDVFKLNDQSDVQLTAAEDLPKFITARVPLEQVFRNLIQNAVKHNDKEQCQITVEVQDLETWYEFSIADNGPGIPEQYQTTIFKMFEMLQSRDKVEGSGMGLALVKKIVENYGGKVWVKSATSAGATFYFTWPKKISRVA